MGEEKGEEESSAPLCSSSTSTVDPAAVNLKAEDHPLLLTFFSPSNLLSGTANITDKKWLSVFNTDSLYPPGWSQSDVNRFDKWLVWTFSLKAGMFNPAPQLMSLSSYFTLRLPLCVDWELTSDPVLGRWISSYAAKTNDQACFLLLLIKHVSLLINTNLKACCVSSPPSQLYHKTRMWPINRLNSCNPAHLSEPEPGRSNKERDSLRGGYKLEDVIKPPLAQTTRSGSGWGWNDSQYDTSASAAVLQYVDAKVEPNKSLQYNVVWITYCLPVDVQPSSSMFSLLWFRIV